MRKLAHIRSLGYGLRTWDSPRYMTPGVSPSHSIYDAHDSLANQGEQLAIVRDGVASDRHRLPLDNPTMNRDARIGAQFSSLSAAPIFQSGWQTHWSMHMGGMRPNLAETRTLTKNNNRNAYGRAEMFRATSYNPWPAAGDIYPKAI